MELNVSEQAWKGWQVIMPSRNIFPLQKWSQRGQETWKKPYSGADNGGRHGTPTESVDKHYRDIVYRIVSCVGGNAHSSG